MANEFKRITANLTDTLTAAYTVPAGTTAIVIGCQAANVKVSGNTAVTVVVNDGTSDRTLVNGAVVPQNAALNPVSGKLVLQAADQFRAKADGNNEVQLILSVLEQS